MLTKLYIRNYTLIEDLEIAFNSGMTTITGETGAGKSIILGAISLLTGNRADRSLINNQDKKCIIEAEFNTAHLNLKSLFNKYDIDYSDTTVIRREFNKEGKSRVFINDSPVVLLHLKTIVNNLLDVHSQHENLELNSKSYQINAIDKYAGISAEVLAFSKVFKEFKTFEKQLYDLKVESVKLRENTEYLTHQLNELNDADFNMGEQERLESELDTLNHAEEIKLNLHSLNALLNEGDNPPIEVLREALILLRKTRTYFKDLDESDQRLDSVVIELDDISREISRFAENTTYDPEHLNIVKDRLSLMYQLQQKHKVNSIEELIDIQAKLDHELFDISNLDERIEEAEKAFKKSQEKVLFLSAKITEMRKSFAKEFQENVLSKLQLMGMPNSSFQVEINKSKEIGPNGSDELEFLFSANKGMAAKPIGKVASGGELSRLMLSIKANLAEKTELPSIIFDEIDSGISGEVAEMMGKVIKTMSKGTQVITITHLPQIAAMGTRHLKVYKDQDGDFSKTTMLELNESERLKEVARLLSGEQISEEALNNAKVLLGLA